jgi:hypothetical protein
LQICKGAVDALRAVRERSQAEPGLSTATDVWRCAEDCGLVVDGADGKPRLEDDYSIKPCAPDPGQDAEPGSDRSLQKTRPAAERNRLPEVISASAATL